MSNHIDLDKIFADAAKTVPDLELEECFQKHEEDLGMKAAIWWFLIPGFLFASLLWTGLVALSSTNIVLMAVCAPMGIVFLMVAWTASVMAFLTIASNRLGRLSESGQYALAYVTKLIFFRG